MDLDEVNAKILGPALACLPLAMDSPRARCMLLAIGLQESGFIYRAQVLNNGGKGPARSFWQFEQGGGVKGVLNHSAVSGLAHRVCAERDVPFNTLSAWTRMETDDVLAACMARLLLYTDPRPLPGLNDDIDSLKPEESASWLYYARNWRPGKPHPDKWPGNWARAVAALGGSNG